MNTTTIATPAGPLTVIATDTAIVQAAGFTAEIDAVVATLPPAARDVARHEVRPRRDLGIINKAVAAYLAGDLDRLDEIEVAPHADTGSFIAQAWQALRRIRPGDPVTYTDLAVRAGRPAAVRAAANACARNPVALFVPCHRVLRTDRGLGGYRWGTAVKEWLLAHERAADGR